jgi:hypothetical protein
MTVAAPVAAVGLLLLLACVATVLATIVVLRRIDAATAKLGVRCSELRQRLADLAARAEQADELAAGQQLAQEAVEASTSDVRDVHQAIAGIPFGVLDALPPTRAASNVVRQVHDRTADGVYDAISTANRAAGGVFRFLRRPRTPPV